MSQHDENSNSKKVAQEIPVTTNSIDLDAVRLSQNYGEMAKTEKLLRINIYKELLSIATSKQRAAILTCLLADEDFSISPIPGSLKKFFHMLVYPIDVQNDRGRLEIHELPEDAKVKEISTSVKKGIDHVY